MVKNVLIICDNDPDYLGRMDGMLREKLIVSFEIFAITNPFKLSGFKEVADKALLIISEALLTDDIRKIFEYIIVLGDRDDITRGDANSADDSKKHIRYTEKFQSCDGIIDEILSLCLEMPDIVVRGKAFESEKKLKITGFYTPDRFADQTSFACEYAIGKGREEKTIYMNNDGFCADEELRNESYDEDICDLMYYARCDENKFRLYLERIIRRRQGFDFIPAPLSARQIMSAGLEDYRKLIRLIEAAGAYEHIIMDLHDGMENLYDILLMCDEVMVLSTDAFNEPRRINSFLEDLRKDERFDMDRIKVKKIGKEIHS